MRQCSNCHADISHKKANAKYCTRKCKESAWHKANRSTPEGRERERERNTARYKREARQRREYAISYYWRTHQDRLDYARAYRRDHRDRRRNAADVRYLRMVTNPGFLPFSRAEWDALVRRYRGCCAYCGTLSESLEMDHVVPLSKGGRHAIANILPACRPCNAQKAARFMSDWRLRPEGR